MKSLIIGAVLFLAASGATAPQPPVYTPPPASAGAVRDVDFSAARPLDEDYRAQFERCDRENIFRGRRMDGSRRCSTDPNRVRALLKFSNGAVFFESKMGLDIDGSHKACSDPGSTDQCPTTFRWPGLTGNARFVDSDKFPYVVIPIAGPTTQLGREFRKKTGVDVGDLGVVVFRDKVVPVFVADGGAAQQARRGLGRALQGTGRGQVPRDGRGRTLQAVSRREHREGRALLHLPRLEDTGAHARERARNRQARGAQALRRAIGSPQRPHAQAPGWCRGLFLSLPRLRPRAAPGCSLDSARGRVLDSGS